VGLTRVHSGVRTGRGSRSCARCRSTDHLYVMNAKGGDLHRVTPKGVSVNSFGWSPDGRKLAYETLDETGIYVVSSRGGFTSAVTTDISAGAPSWSPNGREIAYLDDWPGPLIIANPDSGQARTVARDVSSYQWLPDGRGFVLERKREIELLRLKPRMIRRLAPGVAPLVSPDGKEVTFERRGQEAWPTAPRGQQFSSSTCVDTACGLSRRNGADFLGRSSCIRSRARELSGCPRRWQATSKRGRQFRPWPKEQLGERELEA
jgi:Tol biopolymer transport system component